MTKYQFKLSGITSLMMHADNINGQDMVKSFLAEQKAKKNKGGNTESASDRWPAWTWTTYVYHDGDNVAMPISNLIRSLSEAGKQIGKGKSNLKETVMTSIIIDGSGPDEEYLDFKCSHPGSSELKKVPVSEIEKLALDEKATFEDHVKLAKKLGFELDVRRACLNRNSKVIRVRPKFRNWQVSGTLSVSDDNAISESDLGSLFEIAGNREGLGDWRPSSPKSPGKFGQFRSEVQKIG